MIGQTYNLDILIDSEYTSQNTPISIQLKLKFKKRTIINNQIIFVDDESFHQTIFIYNEIYDSSFKPAIQKYNLSSKDKNNWIFQIIK